MIELSPSPNLTLPIINGLSPRIFLASDSIMDNEAPTWGAKLSGEIRMDESYFGGVLIRGNEAVLLEAKESFLACWRGMAGSIQDGGVGLGADPMTLTGAPYLRARSTIPTPLEPNRETIGLCSALVSIWWSITPRSLSINEPRTTLMALRCFGAMLNIFCTTTEVFRGTIFKCI